MGRRIVFPRIWPARAVGSRTLPVTLQPIGPDAGNGQGSAALGVPGPLPVRGGWQSTIAASARIIDGDAISPGRGYMGRTEDLLNTGPAPDRINRGTTARNAGNIGASNSGYNPQGINGWPYDGNALLIRHVMIPRRPITVTPFSRTIDTGVTIPAQPIGDPVSVS